MTDPALDSIFDYYAQLLNPFAKFLWEKPEAEAAKASSEIVCEGELQELDVNSRLQAPKHYLATRSCLYQFAV